MPGFFDEVDSTGIVENHIKQVLNLEDSEAEKILKAYSDIKRDLVDRLSKMPRTTFSAQHLRGVLAQVEAAISAINDHLSGAMYEGSYKAALKGVNHLLTEMSEFDERFTGAVTPINLNATLVAQDTSKLLITRYKTNLDLYGQGLYKEIVNGLTSATIGAVSTDEVVGSISRHFSMEEWKLHRIVRTEMHGIYNRGKLLSLQEMSDDVPGLKKTLIHPMDSRTGEDSIYAAQKHLVADIEEPFEYVWNGKLRSFYAPPDRPNDRAALVPYRKEWGKLSGQAEIEM